SPLSLARSDSLQVETDLLLAASTAQRQSDEPTELIVRTRVGPDRVVVQSDDPSAPIRCRSSPALGVAPRRFRSHRPEVPAHTLGPTSAVFSAHARHSRAARVDSSLSPTHAATSR